MSTKYSLPSLALVCAANPAWSAVANDTFDQPALNTIVVTATRIERSIESVLAPVSAINRPQIETMQPADFTDILNKVAGAAVTRSGGPGSDSSLFLRGTDNKHTLFLIDGQRISSATLGTTSFQFIDPQQIERVEVVRGPRSSLYGSDAIGGIVQIFTRKPTQKPSAYVSAGYGDYDSYRTTAGGSARVDGFYFDAHLAHSYTENFSSLNDRRGANADRDSYRNNSFSGSVGYEFEYGSKLDLSHYYTNARNEFDNVYSPELTPFGESWMQSTKASFDTPFTALWNSNFSVGRSLDDADSYDSEYPGSHTHFRTERDSASWQNDFTLGELQTLTAGVDYYNDKIVSSTVYTDDNDNEIDSRDTKGYFLQYLLSSDVIDLQLGSRRDSIERYGHETTWNASVGFHLPGQHLLVVSGGTGFKAPTPNDLYWPIGIYDYGNPDLKAEKSKNYEVELRGDYKPLRWALSVYQNKIEDLIQWAQDPANPIAWTPTNVATAKIKGADFDISTEISGWQVSGRLSYVDPRDDDSDLFLQKRNRRTLGLDVDKKFGALAVGANWLAQDSRYVDAANTHKLGGYGVVDFHANYDFTKNWQVALRLSNIFNKQYATYATSYFDFMTGDTSWYRYNTERAGWFLTTTYKL